MEEVHELTCEGLVDSHPLSPVGGARPGWPQGIRCTEDRAVSARLPTCGRETHRYTDGTEVCGKPSPRETHHAQKRQTTILRTIVATAKEVGELGSQLVIAGDGAHACVEVEAGFLG